MRVEHHEVHLTTRTASRDPQRHQSDTVVASPERIGAAEKPRGRTDRVGDSVNCARLPMCAAEGPQLVSGECPSVLARLVLVQQVVIRPVPILGTGTARRVGGVARLRPDPGEVVELEPDPTSVDVCPSQFWRDVPRERAAGRALVVRVLAHDDRRG